MKQMLNPKLTKTLMSLVGFGLLTVTSACGELKKAADKETAASPGPTPVNNAPTDITLSPSSIAENGIDNQVVGQFSATDADGKNTFTYAFDTGTGDADNSAFTIVGNELLLNNPADYETKASYSILVKVTDSASATYSKALTVSVTDLNETAPTDITLSSSSIAENGPANQEVGQFSATDADGSDTFTYAFDTGTGDADNSAFTIVGNKLKLNSPADFETKPSYSIFVKVTDSTSGTYSKALTVTVTDDPTTLELDAIQDQVGATWHNGIAWISLINPKAALLHKDTTPACTGMTYTSDNTSLVPDGAAVTMAGSAPKCLISVTPAVGVIGVANITLNITQGAKRGSVTFKYVVEQSAKSFPANATETATSVSFGTSGIATLAGDYISATGSCRAGAFTYTTGTVSGYEIPAPHGACSLVFGTEVSIQPVSLSADNAAKNRTNYSTIAPKTVSGSVTAKFLGRSYLAPSTGGISAPAYTFTQVADTASGTCSTGTMASGVYQVGTSGNCSIRFDVNNPCGNSGVDNSLLRYSTTDANDSLRIDRLMSSNTDPTKWLGANANQSTGTGTANCANSGCHGATTRSSYTNKWALGYANAAGDTTYSVPSEKWTSHDSTGGWIEKILWSLAGGASTGTLPLDPAFTAHDPLNSRFYRKLTTNHSRSRREGWSGSQMPNGCGTGSNPACLTANQQEMMCHWIWNGAPY